MNKKIIVIEQENNITFSNMVEHWLNKGYKVSSTNCTHYKCGEDTYTALYQAILLNEVGNEN